LAQWKLESEVFQSPALNIAKPLGKIASESSGQLFGICIFRCFIKWKSAKASFE